MLHNIEYKLINKLDFATQVEEYRSIIKGKGRIIAKRANVAYGVYRNAMQGNISNPAVLGSIFRAIKIEANMLLSQYTETSN